jgi:DNA end-binding protein Ku
MIRAVDDGLVMQQLMYSGEVRSMKEIDIERTEVRPTELKLARQLIDAQSSDRFDPTQYKDDVSARIEAAISKKVEGQEITMSDAPETTAKVIDLMEALRASLDRKPPKKGAAPVKADEARKPAKRAAAAAQPMPVARKKVKSA